MSGEMATNGRKKSNVKCRCLGRLIAALACTLIKTTGDTMLDKYIPGWTFGVNPTCTSIAYCGLRAGVS